MVLDNDKERVFGFYDKSEKRPLIKFAYDLHTKFNTCYTKNLRKKKQ